MAAPSTFIAPLTGHGYSPGLRSLSASFHPRILGTCAPLQIRGVLSSGAPVDPPVSAIRSEANRAGKWAIQNTLLIEGTRYIKLSTQVF